MTPFKVSIYAADRVFFEGECESIIVPTTEGQFGIWASHSNMIAAIVPGKMSYRTPGGKDLHAAVSNGVLKVENGEALILVDSAELPEEIDINRAEREVRKAKRMIAQKDDIAESVIARGYLRRAMNRLKIKGSADEKTNQL